MKHTDIEVALEHYANPDKAAFFPRFFKTGPGQYGEGDQFLGVTVPHVRAAIKPYRDLPLMETEQLLISPWHEHRLAAVLILVDQYRRADFDQQKPNRRADFDQQKPIYEFYIAHTKYINNWDLVDASAEHIVGPYLIDRTDKLEVLTGLARSSSLWERRIAMLATFHYIKQGRADEALAIIDILLHDRHDLIQKATGWMLREIGKRVDRTVLLTYLDEHAHTMPRTTLRYAIEHLSPDQRAQYMAQANL